MGGKYCAALGLCLAGGIGWAAPEAWAKEPATRFEEVVVTATKAKTPKKEVTRSVTVIPAERLHVERGGFVSGAFDEVPETLVRRTGAIGRTTAVVIRGANARQVHVTVDGAHVASPTTGEFDFNHFTPDNLAYVEVLRGPGGTLYGSDAMGGVINLETRRGEGPMTASYTQEAGQQHTYREVGSFQGGMGPWHLSGSASRTDSDGLSQNDKYENTNLSTRVGYDFNEETRLDLSLRHIFAIVGLDDGAFRPDPNRVDRERQTLGSIRLENRWTSWWSQLLRLSSSVSNFIDNDPSDRAGNASSLFKLDTERYGVEWMNRFTPVEWDTLTVGVEFEDREADNRRFDKAQTTRALYVQNQWRPIDPLTVVSGVRWFRESSFGEDIVRDLSAAYFFAPWNVKVRGGWAEGFRPPTLNELFFPNFGNPNLRPEANDTYEFGAEQVLFEDKVSWSATVFRSDYEGLIQFVRNSAGNFEPVNVGNSRIDGVEAELELKPWELLTLQGSYGNLRANERPSGEELLRTPKNTAGFSVSLSPGKKWELRLEGLQVSSREESTGTNKRDRTKGYLRFDLYGHYRLKDWLKGYFRIENLFDRHYSEVLGFPANDFLATVGVTVER
ncbi:MAG: TonB-dependent receptor [Candidatus Omnitrophica bacterium]|nr:TonB-dependent receptor [Candidatus Omnitrophota bacterium]